MYARKSILQKRLAERTIETLRFDDTEEAIRNRITNYFVNLKGAIMPNRIVMKMVDAEVGMEEVYNVICSLIQETLMNK